MICIIFKIIYLTIILLIEQVEMMIQEFDTDLDYVINYNDYNSSDFSSYIKL